MPLALLALLACVHTVPPLPEGAVLVVPDATGFLGAEEGAPPSRSSLEDDLRGRGPVLAAPGAAPPSADASSPRTPLEAPDGANRGGVPSATPPPAVAVDSATPNSAGPIASSPVPVTASWVEYAVGTMPGRLSAARGGLRGSVPGTYSGVLIRHGAETLLVDGGASRDFEARRRAVGGLTAFLLGQASRGFTPVGHPDALAERPDAALLTHAHFDHVGGLLDVPDLPVWSVAGEAVTAMPGEVALLAARINFIPWEDRPFLYWPQRWEPFGDERVVVVPMPGHTHGSVGVYVQPSEDAAPFFLVGDTAWLREAYEVPTPKGWPASTLDADRDAVDLQLARLHALHAALPSLRIVPAHDRRVYVEVFGAPVPLATPEK